MTKTQSLRIIIIGNLFTYPETSASAANARVYTYARGFAQNGIKVSVITLSNAYGFTGVLEDKGFDCYVALQKRERSENFFIRRFFAIKRYFNVFWFFKYFVKVNGPIHAIILYSRSPFLMIYFKMLAKWFSAVYLLEVTEHPLNDFKKYSLWKLFFPWAVYPLFNGFICISKSMQNYCIKHKGKNAQVVHIPPLIDVDDFLKDHTKPVDKDYLFYSGSLTIHRDGIDILIKAFNKVSQKFPSLKLILGGKWYDGKTKDEICSLINTLRLNRRIILLGFLSKEEIMAYACNAKILCVPRRSNIQTNSAFPIKLAEYLATGKPVLATSVGDIPDYITDGKNGYLSEPGSVESLTEKILNILENYDEALKVGSAGKKVALEKFSCLNGTLKILNLVTDIKSEAVLVP